MAPAEMLAKRDGRSSYAERPADFVRDLGIRAADRRKRIGDRSAMAAGRRLAIAVAGAAVVEPIGALENWSDCHARKR
jgi:hypothetical protein